MSSAGYEREVCSYPAGGTVPDVVPSISTAVTGVVGRKNRTKLLVVTRERDGELEEDRWRRNVTEKQEN